MTEKLKQTIKEEVEKLPKEAQGAIASLDWANIVEKIGSKFLLTENEINDFQIETLLVLIGIQREDLYAENIENNIGTSKEAAEKISEEVAHKIFTPISETIVENLKKNKKVIDANWEQNLNFVLSDGDYSSFIEKRYVSANASDTKETNIPIKPEKADDVKLKLVI